MKNSKFKRELERTGTEGVLKKTRMLVIYLEYKHKRGHNHNKRSFAKTLAEIENPRINGLEGFFILESSLDVDPFQSSLSV